MKIKIFLIAFLMLGVLACKKPSQPIDIKNKTPLDSTSKPKDTLGKSSLDTIIIMGRILKMRIIKNTGYYPLTDNMDIDVDSDGVNDFRFNNYIDFSLATGTVGLASFLSLQPNALYFGHFNTKDTTYIHTTKSALTYDTTNKVYYTYYNSTYYCKNEPSNDAINSIAPQVYLYNISDSTKIRMHNEWVSGTSYTFNYNYIEPGSPGGNQVGDTVAYTFYHYNLTCKDFPIGVVRYIAIKVNNKLGWIKLKFTGSYPRCMVNIIETAIQK